MRKFCRGNWNPSKLVLVLHVMEYAEAARHGKHLPFRTMIARGGGCRTSGLSPPLPRRSVSSVLMLLPARCVSFFR